MYERHQDISTRKLKSMKCRHCGADIETESLGCDIHEDYESGIQTCYGFCSFDFSFDVVLEYDSLCADCFYNKDIPRRASLCEVLFEGAEPDEDMENYLHSHPEVASWRKCE